MKKTALLRCGVCSSICMAVLLLQVAEARPISLPKLSVLWQEADLVVIIVPERTEPASDLLTSAGPKYGPRDPASYKAFNTRCRVLDILKTGGNASAFTADDLTVIHFAYVRGPLEFDGALVIYFHLPPTRYVTFPKQENDDIARGRGARQAVAEEEPTFLAFLRKREDGRFEPVTGNYDSAPSFRVIGQPLSGAMFYALNGVPGGN